MKNKNINDDLKNLAMDQPEVPEKDPTDAGRPSMGYDRDFDAYIEKAINRRIKKIAARTFIVMLAGGGHRDFLHKPADEADLP